MVADIKRLKGKHGPYFLCIGPHKTGTDWLYVTIAQHPQVWMPPEKEIRYFWDRAYLNKSGFYSRLRGSHWLRQWVKRPIWDHTRGLRTHGFDAITFLWGVKYFALPRTDTWYLRLFHPDKVSGDISPNYYELPEDEVERISKLLRSVKIIISLRNPVERLWSMAKMVLCTNENRRPVEISDQQFLEFFETKTRFPTADYVHLIKRWERHFSSDSILIIFTDELQASPTLLFKKICRFLEIDPPDDRLRQRVAIHVNKGLEGSIRPA
jgi:hypothetical protein